MSWRTRAALESVGVAVPDHRSRQATAADLGHAELVIALAPEHVHWVRRTHPAAADRTATLRRLVRDLARRPVAAGRAGARRSASATLELEPWEEVIDPGGGDAEDVRRAAPSRSPQLVAALAPRLAAAMTARLTADEAAALLRPTDTLGMPLGPGQPPAFLEALGRRHRLGAPPHRRRPPHRAHRPVLPPERPLPQRLLRAARAAAARQRRQHRLRPGRLPPLRADPRRRPAAGDVPPRRRRPTPTGWCSLSLHAGATVAQLHAAGADPDRLLVVEVSDAVPPHLRRSASTATPSTSTRSTC